MQAILQLLSSHHPTRVDIEIEMIIAALRFGYAASRALAARAQGLNKES